MKPAPGPVKLGSTARFLSPARDIPPSGITPH
jgi:hypothetical protein